MDDVESSIPVTSAERERVTRATELIAKIGFVRDRQEAPAEAP